MNYPTFFVTGTDTGVGKTWITLGFMAACQHRGLITNGMKPVAAGCTSVEGHLRHADALHIQQQSDGTPAYATINPFAFEPAIAPHIAADNVQCKIDFLRIQQAYSELQAQAQCTIVEGVGGWRVPLGQGGDVASLVHAMALPVVLVVGLRLGCLNHAILTADAIQRHHKLLGWVGNHIDPEFACAEANIGTLKRHIQAPCLGLIPHAHDCVAKDIAAYLRLP